MLPDGAGGAGAPWTIPPPLVTRFFIAYRMPGPPKASVGWERSWSDWSHPHHERASCGGQ
eukprot:1771875-Alexandrium_andersonii.AAC.1